MKSDEVKMKPAKPVCVAIFLFAAFFAYPQQSGDSVTALPDETDSDEIVLPAVEASGEKESPNTVTREQIDREGAADLWEAMRNVPGFVRSGGGGTNNESGFKVRGFDESRMPVFIDGAPQASGYWGDADYARLLTGDLESVEVEKGYSSMLLGANTMGGAIIMRTAKPKMPFEFSLGSGVDIDSAGKYSGNLNVASIGSRLDSLYGKAVFQYRDIDHYRLSEKFVPYDSNPQGSGDRLNSDSKDMKLTALAGCTPAISTGQLDINFSYVFEDAEKGKSPETVKGQVYRTDDWPLWRRSFATLDGSFASDFFYAKTLLFLDKHDTELVQTNSLVKKTFYNDDLGFGVRLEGGFDFNASNNIKAALNIKQENHKGFADNADDIIIKESVWSGGAEYTVRPLAFLDINALSLGTGLGFDILRPGSFWIGARLQAEAPELKQTTARYMFSWQTGVFYDISANHQMRFTYAKKNHIPSMGQRYEPVRQDAIPNPELKNETASHYEIGYKGLFAVSIPGFWMPAVNIDAAAYYADIIDMIAEANQPTPTGGVTKIRLNVDKAARYGFELGAGLRFSSYFDAGGSLSFNRYELKSNSQGFNTEGNYPRTTASLFITVNPLAALNLEPLESLSVIPAIEYEGPRYGHTTALNVGNALERFTLVSIKISAVFAKYWTLTAACENLLDENYSLDNEYLPLAGRAFNVALKFNISR